MGAEKENVHPNAEDIEPHIDLPAQPLSQRSITKEVRDCPQTPLGRLPLSQLLASGEDPRQHLNFTPIERVLWDNSPLHSDPTNPIPTRKGRKRAYSSSPASSSQNETSNHFKKEKKAADVQALQEILKTPKVDPSDDLWSRYSLNTRNANRLSPTAPAGASFIHLMHSSSPQTPATHIQKDSGGLRRALSCIEWPTSAAKRRKLFHNNSQRNSTTSRSDSHERTVERSTMSKVSLLIEKIHDGLAKPAAPLQNDSSTEAGSSSPVNCGDVAPSSPAEDSTSSDKESQRAVGKITNVLSQTAVTPPKDVSKPLILSDEEIASLQKADSSDFDDDDLDLEMIETIDATAMTASSSPRDTHFANGGGFRSDTVLGAKAKDGPPDTQRHLKPESVTKDEEIFDVHFSPEESSSIVQGAPLNQDEFDEDGNDIFTADLEDIYAKYDSQMQPEATRQLGSQPNANAKGSLWKIVSPSEQSAPQTRIEVVSDDDDFGDDSDFEQIAAECAQGAQKQQVSQPPSSVCTLKSGSCM